MLKYSIRSSKFLVNVDYLLSCKLYAKLDYKVSTKPDNKDF
jgi:hypothetical protein